MVWKDLGRDADQQNARGRDKLLGVYIGVLAVILALCSLGGSNAAQDAMLKNIEASNIWAFFQAKNARRQAFRLHADNLEVMLSATPAMPDSAKVMVQSKVTEYRDQDKLLTSDPDRKEGLDELWIKGKTLEAARNEALKRGPYFDYGQALLQIAIVLASVAILSGGNILIVASLIVPISPGW